MSKAIVHAIGAFIAGGAEKFVTDLSIQMRARNNKVFVLALSSRDDVAGLSMKEKLQANGITYLCGPTAKVGLKSILWFRNTIMQIKPEILNLHTPNTELAYYLGSLILFNKQHKLYRTIHNTEVKYSVLTKHAFDNNQPGSSIACGVATYDVYKNIIANNLCLIDNGVAFTWPIKNIENTQSNRKELNLNTNKKHFLSIGSMSGLSVSEAQKAQNIIIDAWIQAGMTERDAILHLIGDGNLRDELEILSKDVRSIVFHGIQSDIHKWLLSCDYFVMASRYEGLPIAGIEAVSSGLPCIFSKIKPLMELDPPSATWFDVNDSHKLGELFVDAVTNSICVNNIKVQEFRGKYSISKTADKYLELYGR